MITYETLKKDNVFSIIGDNDFYIVSEITESEVICYKLPIISKNDSSRLRLKFKTDIWQRYKFDLFADGCILKHYPELFI